MSGRFACSVGDHVVVVLPPATFHGWLDYMGSLWVCGSPAAARCLAFVPRYWAAVAAPL